MRPLICLLAFGCSSGGLSPGSSGPTQVLAGAYTLVGVTDSNLLLLHDQSHQVSWLPLVGGKPTAIGVGDITSVSNDVVFLYSNVDVNSQSAVLASWTSSGGLHPLSQKGSLQPPFVSADGQWLLYFDNPSSDGKLADIVSSRADGSRRQTLATQAPIDCFPYAQSLGSAWLLAYCKSFDSTTFTGDANLERFDPAANQRTVLLADQSSQPFFTVDAAGTHAFAVDGQGNGFLYDSSGQPEPIDQDVSVGYFTSDGAIVYLTLANELKRYQQQITTLATLSTQSFPFLDDVSPDGKTALVSLNLGTQDPYGLDLWSASAQTPSTPKVILDTPTGEPGGYAGVGSFTKDSSYTLYIDPWGDNFYGPLHAAATAGGPSFLVANDVLFGFATHGSRLVLCANQDQTARTCDLVSVDAAQPSKAVTVAGHVPDYGVFLTHDGSAIVWSIDNPAKPAGNGVYVMATP